MKGFLKIIAVLAAGMVAGAYLQECRSPEAHEPAEGAGCTVTDTLTYYDTIPYYLPEPRREVQLGTRITLVPVFQKSEELELLELLEESEESESSDSVEVEIPVVQREYEGDDYRAWVSGCDPRLDSLIVFPRRDVVTIRELPARPKRWGIGVFAGYGMTPHGLEPCAGISINYNLWNF